MSNIDVELFVKKWLTVFSDNNMDFLDVFEKNNFPKDCEDFGFEMDCGSSFCSKYGTEAFFDLYKLEEIIESTNETILLGNVLYSKWRYFNKSDYCQYTKEDNKWFTIILKRLKELYNH